MTSRSVGLTAAFLALAAGGTAACDSSYEDYPGGDDTSGFTYDSDPGGYSNPGSGSSDSGSSGSGSSDSSGDDDYVADDADDSADEVFYCADEDGEIVDEDFCADDGGYQPYFLWHSSGYARGLSPGTLLDDGDYFPAGDRTARKAFKLPSTGKVSNGTVKTNVVGRGSGGSGFTGSSGG
jgi:hypothetical protein